MSLPRSFVQFALNFFEKPLRDVREVRALGDILTDESLTMITSSGMKQNMYISAVQGTLSLDDLLL